MKAGGILGGVQCQPWIIEQESCVQQISIFQMYEVCILAHIRQRAVIRMFWIQICLWKASVSWYYQPSVSHCAYFGCVAPAPTQKTNIRYSSEVGFEVLQITTEVKVSGEQLTLGHCLRPTWPTSLTRGWPVQPSCCHWINWSAYLRGYYIIIGDTF